MSFLEEEKVSIKSIIENQNIRLINYDTFYNFTVTEGKVKAYSRTLGKYFVLKSLYDYKYFMNELRIINAVNCHDNIINFYGVSMDPSTETYHLVLQYAKDGNLRTYLRNNFEAFDWKTKINMAKDLASGLQFIHQANIIHRNLNPNNIFVHKGRLLIADFELSKSLDSDSDSMVDGEVVYADPEYLRNPKEYNRNKTSDIYSLGEAPIHGTPLDYINIYSSAWVHNPSQRPTIKNICKSLENIGFSFYYISPESIEEFENNEFGRDPVSSYSSALEITENLADDINDIVNSYNRKSSPTIEDHRKLLPLVILMPMNDRKWIGKGAYGIVDSATLIDEEMTRMKVALKSIIVRNDDIKLFVNE
ncbi:1161_t:CDS:2, partial [Diversispora eburnea]